MIGPLLPVVYLAVCALTAYFGRNRRIGYWGTFLLTIPLTPLVMLVALVLLAPMTDAPGHAERPGRGAATRP
ncbi:MAG: hypothetical protein JOY64_17550 [Alphaproteobacteria bacterium]|nr:hypothetical protein [Alphaproteobacteria bacterium]MBV8409438.1 hypothetical protein [Alphaproteobacteria bacterium]